VAVFDAFVENRDVFPWEVFELAVQGGLVGFDGQDVVGAAVDDGLGGVALAVQSIGGDDRPGDVDSVEKCSQLWYFVGLGAYGELGEHDTGLLAQSGQKVHQVTGAVAGSAQRFAVECDHPTATKHAGVQPHPRAEQRVEPIGGQPLQTAANRRLARDSSGHPQPRQGLGRDVGGPPGDRRERARPGDHRR
jgi:hypothetical protein